MGLPEAQFILFLSKCRQLTKWKILVRILQESTAPSAPIEERTLLASIPMMCRPMVTRLSRHRALVLTLKHSVLILFDPMPSLQLTTEFLITTPVVAKDRSGTWPPTVIALPLRVV